MTNIVNNCHRAAYYASHIFKGSLLLSVRYFTNHINNLIINELRFDDAVRDSACWKEEHGTQIAIEYVQNEF